MVDSYNIPAGTRVNVFVKPKSTIQTKKKSSSSPPRIISTSVVGNVITDYYSDGTSRTVQTTGKVGSATPKETAKLTPIKTSQAVIQGKVYENVTQTEALRNQLSKNTAAKFLPSQTSARRQYIQAYTNLQQGKGTSKDLLIVQSGGKGRVEKILKNVGQAYDLSNQNEIARYTKEVYNALPVNEQKFADSKSKAERTKYLLRRGDQIIKNQNISKSAQRIYEKTQLLPKIAPRFTPTQQSKFKQFIGGASSAAISEAKSVGRGALKLTTAPSNKKGATFLDSPIFNKYWNSSIGKKHEQFLINFRRVGVSEQKNILKDPDVQKFIILTGLLLMPQTRLTSLGFKGLGALGLGYSGASLVDNLRKGNYREAGSAGFNALLSTIALKSGGIKGGKTIKVVNVKKIPKITRKFKFGTILKDSTGKLKVVGRGGRTQSVTKSYLVQQKKLESELVKRAIKSKKGREPMLKTKINKQISKAKQDFAEFTKDFESVSRAKAKAFKKQIEPLIIKGKKAQAGRGRKLSKAALRRQSAGLGSKQGQLRFNQGEYVQKASPKKGITESVRYNTITQQTTLVRSGKGVRTSITYDKNFNTLGGTANFGKGNKLTLGKKGFSRPASQVKTNRMIEKDLPFIINRNSGYYKVLQSERIQFQKSILSKSPKFIPKGSKTPVILRQIPKTKTILSKKLSKSTLSKSPSQMTRQLTGRERVRAKLIAQAKAKQQQLRFKQSAKKGVAFKQGLKLSLKKDSLVKRTFKKPATQSNILVSSKAKIDLSKTDIPAVGKIINFKQPEQVDLYVGNSLSKATALFQGLALNSSSVLSKATASLSDLAINKNIKIAQRQGLSLSLNQIQSQSQKFNLALAQSQVQLQRLSNQLDTVKSQVKKVKSSGVKTYKKTTAKLNQITNLQKNIKNKLKLIKEIRIKRNKKTKQLIEALKLKFPKLKPKILKRKPKKTSKTKKKRKYLYTPTIKGLGKKRSKSRRRRVYTGTETRSK